MNIGAPYDFLDSKWIGSNPYFIGCLLVLAGKVKLSNSLLHLTYMDFFLNRHESKILPCLSRNIQIPKTTLPLGAYLAPKKQEHPEYPFDTLS
ncbi:hypothetical protein [Caedibacter taeniospiralis]|jgi:hypothetical protein|uniref:hypothetical protein n=1 Tax=Caedibacter taeniospiralis TaxID=28907 RepID=UPI0037C172E1